MASLQLAGSQIIDLKMYSSNSRTKPAGSSYTSSYSGASVGRQYPVNSDANRSSGMMGSSTRDSYQKSVQTSNSSTSAK